MRAFRADRSIVAAIVASLLLTACGSSANGSANSGGNQAAGRSGSTDVFDLKGANGQQQLLAAAKKEGHVIWSTSLTGPVVKGMVDAFEQKYPGITVAANHAGSSTIATQLVQDAKAKKYLVDVLEISGNAETPLASAGILQPFYSPGAAKLASEFRVAAGSGQVLAASDRVSYISFGYNKQLVPAAAVPKTVKDLLNPALKGKLYVGSGDPTVLWIGSVLHGMGNAAGSSFLKQLVKQQHVGFRPERGAGLMGLVANGTIPAATTIFNDHAAVEASKGAPVAWVGLSPVEANVGYVAIVKHAPHAAAAVLFADFVLSSGGRAVLNHDHYLTPADKVPFRRWVPQAGITPRKYQAEYKVWQGLDNQLFPH